MISPSTCDLKGRLGGDKLVGELRQEGRNPVERHPVVGARVPERTPWHIGRGGIGRILHHRNAAGLTDRHQPRSAVVEHTGQDNTDGEVPVGPGCRPEQWIDRGPGPVLTRTAGQVDAAILE
jgi:hypothetical protein